MFLLAAVLLTAAGCSAPSAIQADPLGGAPADFTLDVTVLVGDDVQPASEAHLQRSRYVLFPDGLLHYQADPQGERGQDWLPPLMRVLNRRQVAEVWSLIQQLGFAEQTGDDGEPFNFKLVHVQPDERVYLLGVQAHGRRLNFKRGGLASEAPDAAMVQLVRRLAELAWASDLPEQPIRTLPRRYDFGPDPYAPYRQP